VAKVLLDTVPQVVWLDKGDGDHARYAAFFSVFQGQLVTTWQVLTEAGHLLPRHIVGRFMRWVAAEGVAVRELSPTAADDIAVLMEKYDDLPMDLADASLVWLAEQAGLVEISTLDETDFGIYQLPTGQFLTNHLMR
jgi:predicted nucleic acid-binding protein